MNKLDVKYQFKENTIYCGDNLDVLKDFPEECVDLIYIDPPFFSNRTYEVIWEDGYELRAFEDRWQGGIQHYLGWMKPRIEQLHRILEKTGSFYLHCDHHASHYLKILCDDIFRYKNFQNEIVWCYTIGGKSKKRFARKHDIIFFYTKGKKWTFNGDMVAIPRPKTHMKVGKDKNGREYQEKTDKKTGKIYRYYIDKGKIPEDYWTDIETINREARERLGYPTQKPKALLERIIKASSNEGDIVLDAFCGCGTTIKVAKDLNRKFIGIDVSPTACRLMAKRIHYKKDEIIGMKYSIEELKELPPFEFQNWVVERIGGRVNPRKTGDMGIDGIVPISEYGANLPVEVKQHSISRPDVDKFETVLRRTKKKVGFIVGFKFSRGASEEIARCKNEEKLDIIAITIEELLAKNKK